MNLLLILFFSVASVIGTGAIMKSGLMGRREHKSFSLQGMLFSNLLGSGSGDEKPKAKILDKTPLGNPETSNPESTGVSNVMFNRNKIPMMRGVDNGNSNIMNQGGVPMTGGTGIVPAGGGMQNRGMQPGAGLGAVAMVGLANGIGMMAQNAGNINNLSKSRKNITGVVYQGAGMIYNVSAKGRRRIAQSAGLISNYNERGRSRYAQNADNILNEVGRGKITMKQGDGARTAIANGRTRVTSKGQANNYIYGKKTRVRSRIGNIHTQDLRLLGVSKPKSMLVQNLHAPKAKRLKIQELNNNGGYIGKNKGIVNTYGTAGVGMYMPLGQMTGKKKLKVAKTTPRIAEANNIKVNLNDVNLQKNNDYSLQNRNYSLNKSTNDYVTMVEMSNISKDPRNKGLNSEQKTKLYTLTTVRERYGDSSRNSEIGSYGEYNREDLYRQLVKTVPEMSTKDMRKVASEANRLGQERKRKQQAFATQMADQKMDMNREGRNALNDMLRDTTGSAAAHLHSFIEDNFKDEITRELSQEEVKKIEQQARENISKRNDIPLEQKEEEYEKEKDRLLADKEQDNSGVIEELLKERILENPSEAKNILGEENAEKLQNKIKSIENQRDTAITQESIKQELRKNSEFVKKHPEFDKARFDKIYSARKSEEMNADIQTAVGNLYSDRTRGNSSRYQGKMNPNTNSNNPQPQVSSQNIYVPRNVQERTAGGAI